jgi:D-alanyl-lipoteichoic acid acyltransferase DltB (MBOAT superfamily)
MFIPVLMYVVVIIYGGGRLLAYLSEKEANRAITHKRLAFVILSVLLFVPLVAYKILNWNDPSIILPFGISFYTLQAYSYIHSIYQNEIETEKDPVLIALFVSFFPFVSSGPIMRAKALLPQLKENKAFSYDDVTDGLKLYAFGLFKKLVLADNIAIYIQNVNLGFGQGYGHGLAAFVAAVLYSLELYLDFSGYSDIVIGCSRALGLNVDRNFDHPYLARTITEFWRRWHISLSSWLRDYVYFPLGGSRKGSVVTYRNIIIVFLVSGFWHGSGWNFIVWGLMNGAFQCIERIVINATDHKYKGSRVLTFLLVTLAWMFFSAGSVVEAVDRIRSFAGIPTDVMAIVGSAEPLLTLNEVLLIPQSFNMLLMVVGLIIFIVISLMTYEKDGLQLISKKNVFVRWGLYYDLILSILFFAASEPVSFIYNKF